MHRLSEAFDKLKTYPAGKPAVTPFLSLHTVLKGQAKHEELQRVHTLILSRDCSPKALGNLPAQRRLC